MINMISSAMARISSLFQGIQVKKFFAVALVGFVLLTTGVDSNRSNHNLEKKVDRTVHQIDSERPKTTGEWQQEAREVKGNPGERLQNILDESGQAVKEWGGLYPDTAERSVDELKSTTSR
jgi:mevalonate kinase